MVVPRHTSGKKFTPIERIVVGVDGTDQPSSALRRSIAEARLWGARLTAVSAVPIAVGPSVMTWTPTGVDHSALLAQVREGMDAAIKAALDGEDVHVSRHALDGSAASLLIEFSTAVDLVVVGTRGRGGLAGVLLGSTSQTVLGHSTCPVMVVPSAHLGEAEASVHTPWERR